MEHQDNDDEAGAPGMHLANKPPEPGVVLDGLDRLEGQGLLRNINRQQETAGEKLDGEEEERQGPVV